MSSLLSIARTGSAAILLSPLRSVVTVLAVVVVLVPYLVGTGLVEGLRQEARIAMVPTLPRDRINCQISMLQPTSSDAGCQFRCRWPKRSENSMA